MDGLMMVGTNVLFLAKAPRGENFAQNCQAGSGTPPAQGALAAGKNRLLHRPGSSAVDGTAAGG